MFRRRASFILLSMSLVFASAQALQSKVSAGKTDADGMPLTGATLCLQSVPAVCFQMPASHNGDVTYEFGLDPHAKLLPWRDRNSVLLFDSMFSGGGSGTLTRYAVLREDCAGPVTHLTNVLPYVALTNNSDHAVWNESEISPYPLLVTADFIWDFDAGETHFSQHRFTIAAWRYNPAKDVYVLALSYKTAKKYDGLDASDSINVIAPERPEILRRLHSLNQKY